MPTEDPAMNSPAPTELLPCPFCGSAASVEEVDNAVGRAGSVCFSVGCDSKDEDSCMGYQLFQTFALRKDAIKAWNTRQAASVERATYTDVCKNDKCPRGGLPVEIVLPVLVPDPNSASGQRVEYQRSKVTPVERAEVAGEAVARANLREARSALAMIRETVEQLGPVGALKAEEQVGPTFMHEAEEIVRGIKSMDSRKALEDCLGCVIAAETEGLYEVIEELRGTGDTVERLIDLVERRLLWVRNYAEPALGRIAAPATIRRMADNEPASISY